MDLSLLSIFLLLGNDNVSSVEGEREILERKDFASSFLLVGFLKCPALEASPGCKEKLTFPVRLSLLLPHYFISDTRCVGFPLIKQFCGTWDTVITKPRLNTWPNCCFHLPRNIMLINQSGILWSNTSKVIWALSIHPLPLGTNFILFISF